MRSSTPHRWSLHERALEFEPLAVHVVNHPQADALLRCEYRPGWSLRTETGS